MDDRAGKIGRIANHRRSVIARRTSTVTSCSPQFFDSFAAADADMRLRRYISVLGVVRTAIARQTAGQLNWFQRLILGDDFSIVMQHRDATTLPAISTTSAVPLPPSVPT
jgi:hypothetical protein